MEKEFIPYEQAVALKELGFDEPCFRGWYEDEGLYYHPDSDIVLDNPTFSQAFRWFREKYGYDVTIKKCTPSEYKFEIEQLFVENNYYFIDFPFPSYEVAELECLKKLKEIVKKEKL